MVLKYMDREEANTTEVILKLSQINLNIYNFEFIFIGLKNW
jgi:hypothetical protein